MKLGPKALLPAAVLVGSLAASAALVVARPSPEAQAAAGAPAGGGRGERRAARAAPAGCARRERSSRAPRTSSWPRWAGASPGCRRRSRAGSFFAAGELLARIEPADYEIARERARAALERARSQRKLAEASLARSRALARGRRRERRRARPGREQRRDRGRERSATPRRALRQAELDLARTELRVPFAGRVRERTADVGPARRARRRARERVRGGLRRAAAADPERRAGLPRAAARADATRGRRARSCAPTARFAGRAHTWQGRVVRAEGALDPRTRLVHVVARVDDPVRPRERRAAARGGPVRRGRDRGPRGGRRGAPAARALRERPRWCVVDADAKLRTRRVEVLRVDGETVVVSGGLAAGERVVARVPSTFVEGMRVRVGEQPRAPPVEAGRARERRDRLVRAQPRRHQPADVADADRRRARAWPTLRQEMFPDIDLEVVTVTAPYPGAVARRGGGGALHAHRGGGAGPRRREARPLHGGGRRRAASRSSCTRARTWRAAWPRSVRASTRSRAGPRRPSGPSSRRPSSRSTCSRSPSRATPTSARLKRLAEQARDELAALPEISEVDARLGAARRDRDRGLRRGAAAATASPSTRWSRRCARSSLDLPGGSVHAAGGEILLRAKGRAYRRPRASRSCR